MAKIKNYIRLKSISLGGVFCCAVMHIKQTRIGHLKDTILSVCLLNYLLRKPNKILKEMFKK